jgi:hypothetical protein
MAHRPGHIPPPAAVPRQKPRGPRKPKIPTPTPRKSTGGTGGGAGPVRGGSILDSIKDAFIKAGDRPAPGGPPTQAEVLQLFRGDAGPTTPVDMSRIPVEGATTPVDLGSVPVGDGAARGEQLQQTTQQQEEQQLLPLQQIQEQLESATQGLERLTKAGVGQFDPAGVGAITADPTPRGPFGRAAEEFAGGLLDPKDLQAKEGFELAGSLTNIVGQIALEGTGGEVLGTKLLKYFDDLKNTRRVKDTLAKAARVGQRIDDAGGLVKVGDKFGDAKTVITSQKEADIINNILISEAQKASPSGFKTLMGFSIGGTVTGGIGVSIWSGFSLRNSYSDTQQQLGIMETNLLKAGDFEGAEQVRILKEENTVWYESVNHIFSEPVTAGVGVAKFVDATEKAADILRESELSKAEKRDARNALDISFTDSVLNQQMTPEEIVADPDIKAFAEDPENTFTNTNKVYNDAVAQISRQVGFEESDVAQAEEEQQQEEQERAVDVDRLQAGQDLIDRILRDRPTAQDLVDDAEIRAWALDPNNTFSAITKLYNEAVAAIGRGAFFGDEGGGVRTRIDPPSTLNFGLLQTGSELIEEKEGTPPEAVTAAETDEEAAQRIFGVSFASLTEAQKEVVRTR